MNLFDKSSNTKSSYVNDEYSFLSKLKRIDKSDSSDQSSINITLTN